ncbi:hypothetical protein [Streptococcus pluranimalium]|uniref:Uncharacterized protein n=1 Tax=Streptococcus pluranimalium TaxID=82348 RepID=A0A345VH52_9STRE|nr:hypothetical protein [Streptococcus pluranimalium]AXJ12054.1 hypothetical protein Sp14A_00810 [Streptococcus pluranimalium]
MLNYFRRNKKLLFLIIILISFLGPIFSELLSFLSPFLNDSVGDWLSFYGSMAGTVISVLIIHLQLFLEKERAMEQSRPVLILSNEYQTIKSGFKIYYDNKFWYSLTKRNKNTNNVSKRSFEEFYQTSDKMDKALSIEILNGQPLLNLHIIFDNLSPQIIPKIDANERIYVISKEHQNSIFSHLMSNNFQFNHLPNKITLYYTTLSGEVIKTLYQLDDKGNCRLIERRYNVDYPEQSIDSRTCDYIVKV